MRWCWQRCVRWSAEFTDDVPLSAVCVMKAGLVRRVTTWTVIRDVHPALTDTVTTARVSVSRDGTADTAHSVRFFILLFSFPS